MTPFRKPLAHPPAIARVATDWLADLAMRLVARSLDMPAPLVLSAGLFAYAQVQAAEHRAARRFCALRAMRRLRAWLRAASV